MTRTRYTLDDLGGALSERALLHFVHRLPPDSETWRETHPGREEESRWSDASMLPMLVARIADTVQDFEWAFAQSRSKKRIERPRPIDRPGVGRDARRYGRDPIPIADFERWWSDGQR